MQADFTVEELFIAYYDCRRAKRNTVNALRFEEHLERNMMDLFHELQDGSYAPGPSICFVVTYPKVREVWAADFRDRIVHHLLYNHISDRFYRRFIHDSYACIPGRGVHFAADRVGRMIRSASENYSKPTWYLKADIANFFVSIDKHVLDGILARHISEPWWLRLCRTILHSDPCRLARIRSPAWLLARVPRHKSLFHSKGRGLPIGNLSSQFFANVYMNELDQFVKRQMGRRYYGRYVDDIVILSNDGSELRHAAETIDQFLRKHLRIGLHPKKTDINQVEAGLNFVGFIHRPYARYVRRSTIDNFKRKIDSDLIGDPDQLRIVVNSYFGLLRNADTFGERDRVASLLRERGHWCDRERTKLLLPKRKAR